MRLSQDTIREIITCHNRGDAPSKIASRLAIDASTVKFHIERVERTYGTTNVYSVAPPTAKVCIHPSLKCLLCGHTRDHIRRREREKIKHLEAALEAANSIIVQNGYEPRKPAV